MLSSDEGSHIQDLQRGTVSQHGEPLTFYSFQCAVLPLFHYAQYNAGERPPAGPGFEHEFCHLLDHLFEQISQSETPVPHLYKIK